MAISLADLIDSVANNSTLTAKIADLSASLLAEVLEDFAAFQTKIAELSGLTQPKPEDYTPISDALALQRQKLEGVLVNLGQIAETAQATNPLVETSNEPIAPVDPTPLDPVTDSTALTTDSNEVAVETTSSVTGIDGTVAIDPLVDADTEILDLEEQ